jgi:hypothetical protein
MVMVGKLVVIMIVNSNVNIGIKGKLPADIYCMYGVCKSAAFHGSLW